MLQMDWLKKGLIVLIILIGTSEKIWADAPFFTDDPLVMKPGTTQGILYGVTEFSKIVNSTRGPGFEFDYAVSKQFEIDTYLPILTNTNAKPNLRYLFPNETGLSDLGMEFKYLFYPESKYVPALGFAPNIYFPTGNAHRGLGNGRFWYYLPILAHKTFNTWNTYGEVAYVKNSAPTCKNYFFESIVLQKQISEKLTLGTELYSQGASNTFSPSYTLLNFGGYYFLSTHFSLLGSLGHSITGQEVWMGYLGIAYS